jgi:hypothetical protein
MTMTRLHYTVVSKYSNSGIVVNISVLFCKWWAGKYPHVQFLGCIDSIKFEQNGP